MGLTQANGAVNAYDYDYRTRRVRRQEGSSAARVAFSGGVSVLERPGSGGGAPGARFVRGGPELGGGVGGLLYSLRAGSGPSFAHYDSRGDVVMRTDGAGAVTSLSAFDAFGSRSQTWGATEERQQANTKEEDPTGLLNEGMRYRDLEAGVFLTRDPAGFVDGPNLYTYVRQNPWSKFDPEGLLEKSYVEDVEDFSYGLFRGVGNMVGGAAHAVIHPIATIQGVGELAGNLYYDFPGTASAIGKNIQQGASNALNDAAAAGEITSNVLATATPIAAARLAKAAEAANAVSKIEVVSEVGSSAARAAAEAEQATANMGEVLYMKGRPVPPTVKTLADSLDPVGFANQIAEKYRINLRGVQIVIDDTLRTGVKGVTRETEGGNIIRLGREAFENEATVANTIAHELSHARDFRRGAGRASPELHKPHGSESSPAGDGSVYGSGKALEEFIYGLR